MGVYNDKLRKKIEAKWQSDEEKKMASLSDEAKVYYIAITEYISWNDDKKKPVKDLYEKLKVYFDSALNAGEKPSKFFYKDAFKEVIDAFLTDELKEYFLYIADKCMEFQYQTNHYLRSLHIKDYSRNFQHIMFSLHDFIGFAIFTSNNLSFKDYITNNMSEELIDYKLNVGLNGIGTPISICYILAAALDKKDKDIEKAVENVILSWNNSAKITAYDNMLTRDIIKGVVRSSNKKLHNILADLLISARLKEGLRRAICENIDSDTAEAFLTLLKTIADNNLIRFSYVKNAVSSFINIYGEKHIDKINHETLTLMEECLYDEKKRKKCFNSSDAIEINVALWAEGFYDAEKAGKETLTIFENAKNCGIKERMLAAAFFARTLQIENITDEIAKSVINEHGNADELTAICMSFFYDKIKRIIDNSILNDYIPYARDSLPAIKNIEATNYFGSSEDSKKLYESLMKIYRFLKKDKTVFSPCVFPWNTETLFRSNIVECLCVLAYSLKDQKKKTEVIPLLKHIEPKRRSINITYLLNNPKTKLDLTEDEYIVISEMLKYKGKDRANIINILYKQSDGLLLKTLTKLVPSKNENMRLGAMDIILKLSKDKNRIRCYEKLKTLTGDI